MTIPVLVEPTAVGYRATTGGPFDLSADAATAAEAINALQDKIARRLQGGAFLIDQPVLAPQSPIPVLPLSENPLFDSWLAAVETYRLDQENQEGSDACEAQ